MYQNSKKLVLVSAIFALVTEASKKNDIILDWVPCIHYLLRLHKEKKNKIRALIKSGNEINTMKPAYALELGLRVYQTDVRAQKINGSIFKIFEMILASFQVENKFKKAQFFQETFLLANISIKVYLQIPFLTFRDAHI